MGQPDLSADLAFAHELADAAAEVSLSWFGHRLPVELKEDATLVTEVDRREQEIRRAIASGSPATGCSAKRRGWTRARTDAAGSSTRSTARSSTPRASR